jgi:hypothetical protein
MSAYKHRAAQLQRLREPTTTKPSRISRNFEVGRIRIGAAVAVEVFFRTGIVTATRDKA